MKKTFLALILLVFCLACTACMSPKTTADDISAVPGSAGSDAGNTKLEPPQGFYFGVVSGDITADAIREYDTLLGFKPASYVTFVDFPLSQQGTDMLDSLVNEIAPTGGIVVISLEPMAGLDTVTEQVCKDFAGLCAKYETMGVGVMVRFAHEMNGSWYPWGQQPILYKEKFQLLANCVHENTRSAAMLWAPNTGGGYPFSGGPFEVAQGSADFTVLDTDGNGLLDMSDDMYTPYYPGDDAVDWVGMSVYHWGNSYPWLENELPEPRSFSDYITGDYNGLNGDQRAVPDFYAMFCSDAAHAKPMAITETSAFYNTELGGQSELAIKQAWWNQVYNISGDTDQALDLSIHFPKIKMINWFDIIKNETEAKGNVIDWRFSGNELIRDAFVADLQLDTDSGRYVLSADDVAGE